MKERQGVLWVSIVALVVGAIGACGQAYLLYHELADCLPYKEVAFRVHQSMANIGIWLAPLVAILVGGFFVRKRFWLTLVLPVILTPLIFAGIYKVHSMLYGLNPIADINPLSDFTTAKAAEQFYAYCLSLGSIGLIIGATLAFLLWFVTKPRKLP